MLVRRSSDDRMSGFRIVRANVRQCSDRCDSDTRKVVVECRAELGRG